MNFHAGATLYETPSKLYIQPRDEPEEALVINRQTGEVSLNEMFSVDFLPYNAQAHLIYGLVGIKQLTLGSYLIVITNASMIGAINGHFIYKIENTLIIPIINTGDRINTASESYRWEQIYLSMLQSMLKTPSFYFSYTYDLTNSLQRNHAISERFAKENTLSQCDTRFHWNLHLLEIINQQNPKIQRYCLTLILGFVNINENALGQGINWILISRRSTRRAGTRFNTRGVDRDGNVANFVETEQIVDSDHTKASSVQIRGSIPLYWNQKPGYKYKPAIVIDDREHHRLALENHLNDITRRYGNVSIACLIDQRGHEGDLAHKFAQEMGDLAKYYNESAVAYHYFDFHKECSKMRWHRLNILLERLEPEISAHGYFAMKGNQVISKQTGVVRSNCIDSLDRTNVVQSMIAKIVLQTQLSLFNAGSLGLDEFPMFMETFKNAWADNADALSIQYAGTPALKTDFTRTGQRTHAGMFKDGLNSLTRYVSNNYLDGYRQDAIDLFLGNYVHYPSPLYRPLELVSYTSMLPVTLVMMTLIALYFYFRWDPLR